MRIILIISILALANACTHYPRDQLGGVVAKGTEESWLLKGRMGLKSPDKTASFRLEWRQTGPAFDIRLSSTLGISVAHIRGDHHYAMIELPKRGRFRAENAGDLLAQHTGLTIPLESLRYWVRGVPAPEIAYNMEGRILHQSGWNIEYLSFKNGSPARIRLLHSEMRIMLAIHSWQL